MCQEKKENDSAGMKICGFEHYIKKSYGRRIIAVRNSTDSKRQTEQ